MIWVSDSLIIRFILFLLVARLSIFVETMRANRLMSDVFFLVTNINFSAVILRPPRITDDISKEGIRSGRESMIDN